MKLLAFLAVIAGVLTMGTEQRQATSIIQTRNTEGVWSETLLRPSGFESNVNLQVANRTAVRGAEDVWQSPLSAPTGFEASVNSQATNRIVVRGVEDVWQSPLNAPTQSDVQPSPPAPTSAGTPTFQPTTSVPTLTPTPSPQTLPQPTTPSNPGDGGIFNSEVLIAVISTIGVIVAAFLAYLGTRAVRGR